SRFHATTASRRNLRAEPPATGQTRLDAQAQRHTGALRPAQPHASQPAQVRGWGTTRPDRALEGLLTAPLSPTQVLAFSARGSREHTPRTRLFEERRSESAVDLRKRSPNRLGAATSSGPRSPQTASGERRWPVDRCVTST